MLSLRSTSVVILLAALPAVLHAQSASPSCNTTAVPAQIRAEGVTERLGDIVITCTGTPGREISGNLWMTINTNLTNRLLTGTNLDVSLTVNTGSGETPANVPATLAGNNQLTFSGLRFSLGPSGGAELRLSNVRGDASGLNGSQVVAQLAFSGGLVNFTNTSFPIGQPQPGLVTTSRSTVVPNQLGSPLSDTIGFLELIASGTLFSSTRVTEGIASAFEPRQAQTDHGTRILLRFSGYPSDARLFVPLVIAGSNAATPTQAGDFGGTPSGGRYEAGSRTLVLHRVLGVDASGTGGYVAVPSVPGGPFNDMVEVPLAAGAGVAVFEVMDSNPNLPESAQIPVFIGLPRSGTARNSALALQVSLAPLSTSAGTSASAPIPRFVNLNASTDCSIYGDCDEHVPRLEAPPVNTTFNLIRGVGVAERHISLGNAGGGLMPWNATVEYGNGRDWILISPASGRTPMAVRMTVLARADMEPGVYEATLVINAGAAGTARYPIKLTVAAPPAPQQPKPAVSSVVHGATFAAGPIAPGAFITLRGSNLTGNNVAVTIGGKPARLVYSGSDQINVQVPSDLAGSTVQIVVSVAGVAGDAVTANVAPVAPGVFNPGILNQDGSVNSASNPANTGSYVQVYATGLLTSTGEGNVDAMFHDVVAARLPYAGNAPGIPGLQQVNLLVPPGLPTMTTDIHLCVTASGQRVCAPPAKVHIRKAD